MVLQTINLIQSFIKIHILYSVVQNIFFSFCPLSKSLKIKIYKTIILPVFSYGCKTGSLMLREEHKIEGV